MKKVKVCSVVGFPLGAASSESKIFETKQAIKDGADEIDMVINIGALKDKKEDFVKNDIQGVVKAAKGRIVKVIIECCYLTDEEKRRACVLAKQAGAHFVKTSTGFGKHPTGGPNGAVIEDVKLMKEVFGGDVKAAGGIKTEEDTLAFIEAGATRIGASAGIAIVEKRKDLAEYIDHTNLYAFATEDDIKKLCVEAKEHGFASVCVNSCHVKLVNQEVS